MFWQRLVTRLLAVVLAVGLVGVTDLAQASQQPEPDATQGDAEESPRPERGTPIPLPDRSVGQLSNSIETWAAGRQLLLLLKPRPASGLYTHWDTYSRLVRLDAVTGEELGSLHLSPPALEPNITTTYITPTNTTTEVDQASGRMLIAYQRRGGPRIPQLGTPLDSNIAAQKESVHHSGLGATAGGDLNDPACTAMNQARPLGCFAGVHVVDLETSAVRSIPLRRLSADGMVGGWDVKLLHMAYSPRPGGDDKVLLVLAGDPRMNGLGADAGQPSNRAALQFTYLVQLDIDSGVQEWVVRLDACRGDREPSEVSAYRNVLHQPHAAAAFYFGTLQGSSIQVGCHSGTTQVGTIVSVPLDEQGAPSTLPVRVVDSPPVPSQPSVGPAPVEAAPAQGVAYGPDKVFAIIGDPSAGRMLMRVIDAKAEVWWVYDANMGRFVGTIGIGKTNQQSSINGFDARTGRLYVLAAKNTDFPGGLFIADTRGTPLSQAIHAPEFADLALQSSSYLLARVGVFSDGQTPTRLYVGNKPVSADWTSLGTIADHIPVRPGDVTEDNFAGRTLDLEEAEGVTATTFDGTARGFGLRAILVAGAEGATRVGPVDPLGLPASVQDVVRGFGTGEQVTDAAGGPVESNCVAADREAVFAFAGPQTPVVMDAAGTRASAAPLILDSRTRSDLERPLSRCLPVEWESLWASALFGRPPMEEPSAPAVLSDGQIACLSTSEEPGSASYSDPVMSKFSATVECGTDDVDGWSQFKAVDLGGVSVAESLASFRIYRDPARGIVVRVDSLAAGVSLDGVVSIGAVRASAESWANGRKFNAPEPKEGSSYEPSCDFERTAGTCFRRSILNLRTPAYSCGPCGDEQRALDGMNRAFAGNATVAFRDPDPVLARGAENGFIAAITKYQGDRFADLVLNNDLVQTVVPALEFIRFANPNRPASQLTGKDGGPRGRQVYQFAGVEAASSYGISCLLVYDETTNMCADEKLLPGSIQVSLSDTDGKPLAGGAFEVREDVDADGVLGLKDTLLPDGACVTAEDGIGTCLFDDLQPGTYLVSQVAAPPGYAKSAEPWVSEVASGEQRTVAFTNVSNVSTIDLKATDEHGAPISGATFAAYPDPDSDGKVAPDAKPAAECTTDGQGVCTMKVPVGSYVLVQTGAPGGLEGIEPVPFTFASGGQVASVTVVNYPPAAPEQPVPATAPIDYTPPVDMAPPREFIDDTYVAAPVADTPVLAKPVVSVPERIGGTVTQVIRAPGDALRLLARDPKQAVAWTAALALFCLAAMAVRRRQQAMALLDS